MKNTLLLSPSQTARGACSRFAVVAKGVFVTSLLFFACMAHGQSVNHWTTSGNQSSLLQQGSDSFGSSATGSSTITIQENNAYQSVDALGFFLSQGAAQVMRQMSSNARSALLNELFGTSGLNLSAIRISIGASDMSSFSYSYHDGGSFSLAGPDLEDLIPIIKQIQGIRPDIKVLATPWSAPRWMKTNNGWVGGSLRTDRYSDYADYFVNYLRAMRGEGIDIWAITPQNEPGNSHNEPSMTMSASEELNFVDQYLGPRIDAAGFSTKIICYDHNCDNTAHPIQVANGSSYVDGSAFHLYGGDISAMTTVRNSTGKDVYFTEQYTDVSGNFGNDLAWHMENVALGSINNWSKSVFEWVIATDASYGPRTPGGCTVCKGAVTIDGSNVTRNVAYYIIGQMSKVLDPGAVRLGTSGGNANLVNSAFSNPDGSRALVVFNKGGSNQRFNVEWQGSRFDHVIGAGAAVSFKWNGGTPPPPPPPPPPPTGCGQSYTAVPAKIEAEDYCDMSGIQTESTSDSGGGENVGWTDAGDWMAYSVEVPSGGSYQVQYRVASQSGGGTIRLESLDGSNLYGEIQVPSTGGWQNWTTISHDVNLAAGQQGIVVSAASGGFNLNWFDISVASGPPPPPPPPSLCGSSFVSIPGQIEAEDYCDMSGVLTESTSDQGGGENVGWINVGDWLAYSIDVPSSGQYVLECRVASPNGGGSMNLESIDGASLYGSVSVPSTGGWQSWTTVSETVDLNAGQQAIAIAITGDGFNLNWIRFSEVSQSIAPVGQTIALRGNNSRYVSSENGSQAMRCDRATPRGWESFEVVDAGGGSVALRGSNGRYVHYVAGSNELRCDSNSIGARETFEWVDLGNGSIALRGGNGLYVSSENGSSAMTCSRVAVGGWEAFRWSVFP